jgi:putative transposase
MIILFISSLDVRKKSRPLRLEFAGALYHITSRGNGRNLIYLQDDDFELFLQVLADVCERYN